MLDMIQDLKIVVPRSRDDRRINDVRPPPYISSEGLVLVDRREIADRRGRAQQTPQQKSIS